MSPPRGLETCISTSLPRFRSGLYVNNLYYVSPEGHSGLLSLSRVTHSANSSALVNSPAAFCGPFNSLLGWAGRDRLLWAVFDSTALCLSLSASPVTTLFSGRHAFDGLSAPHGSTLRAAFGETVALPFIVPSGTESSHYNMMHYQLSAAYLLRTGWGGPNDAKVCSCSQRVVSLLGRQATHQGQKLEQPRKEATTKPLVCCSCNLGQGLF